MLSKFRLVSYTVISNFISTFIASMVAIILPRFISIAEYGYFQLFLFYVGYTGFLPLGWLDGMYLRYGGKEYDTLKKSMFSGQIKAVVAIQGGVGLGVIIITRLFINDLQLRQVWYAIGIYIIVIMPKAFLQMLFQCTGKIEIYAKSVIVDKVIYGIVLFFLLLWGFKQFQAPIVAFIIGLIISLLYLLAVSKSIWKTKSDSINEIKNEAILNIKAGISLMFANIVSILIIGIVRFSIERQWGVATFGKISLTMSVSNMLMVFINAVALVMFPMLRRTNADRLAGIYSAMRICLMMPLLGMLIFYYPMKEILSLWLPQYAESLIYMAILFPMCVYESKMSMLISTYLKTLRKERYLLLVNSVTVILSAISTYVFAFVMHNLNLLILSIVILLAFRCVFAELLLSRVLEISVKKDIVLELALTAIFIFFSWAVGGILGLLGYLVAYGVYIFIQRKQLMALFKIAKEKLYHQKLCERKE